MSVKIQPTIDLIRKIQKDLRKMPPKVQSEMRFLVDHLQSAEDHLLMAMQESTLGRDVIENARLASDYSKTAIAKWVPFIHRDKGYQFSLNDRSMNQLKAGVKNVLSNIKSMRVSHEKALRQYAKFVSQVNADESAKDIVNKLKERQVHIEEALYYMQEAWDWLKRA